MLYSLFACFNRFGDDSYGLKMWKSCPVLPYTAYRSGVYEQYVVCEVFIEILMATMSVLGTIFKDNFLFFFRK